MREMSNAMLYCEACSNDITGETYTCDYCSRDFHRHCLTFLRDAVVTNWVLTQICESCEAVQMARPAEELIERAAEHQYENPFDLEYAAAIQRRFRDAKRYGVWTWERLRQQAR
jgi:hypothetical protein